MNTELEYKSVESLYSEALTQARAATTEELQEDLRNRNAYHSWFVRAVEQALMERN